MAGEAVAAREARYHHGDLPNALRQAAAEVIAERGLGAFSLREVARRAGVSHTAPAHHFGDVRGLLTSLADEALGVLHDALLRAAEQAGDDPVERLTAMGVAYVGLARTHPGHCEVMFRADVIHHDDPAMNEAGLRAYGALESAVREVLAAKRSTVPLTDAVSLCWSAMQGIVQLESSLRNVAELKGREPVATEDLVRRFTAIIAAGLS
jgi:AcrR family transcriptional regulator